MTPDEGPELEAATVSGAHPTPEERAEALERIEQALGRPVTLQI